MKQLVIIMVMILMVSGLPIGFARKNDAFVKIRTSAVCGQCKDRIEQGLAFEKGIKNVTLDVDTKIAAVTYNPEKTNPAKIRSLISKLGYDADTIHADPVAYKKLPACCKKDAGKH